MTQFIRRAAVGLFVGSILLCAGYDHGRIDGCHSYDTNQRPWPIRVPGGLARELYAYC
jgi:hypothetical protein